MFARAGGRKVPNGAAAVFIVSNSVAGAWLWGEDGSMVGQKGVLALCHP